MLRSSTVALAVLLLYEQLSLDAATVRVQRLFHAAWPSDKCMELLHQLHRQQVIKSVAGTGLASGIAQQSTACKPALQRVDAKAHLAALAASSDSHTQVSQSTHAGNRSADRPSRDRQIKLAAAEQCAKSEQPSDQNRIHEIVPRLLYASDGFGSTFRRLV